MKRIYFLVPDLKSVENISADLERAGIVHRHIHAVGRSTAKLEKTQVNLANVLQTTPLVALVGRGFVMGVGLAVFLFFLLYLLLPAHIDMTGWGIAGVAGLGVLFGLWSGGLIGLSRKNPVLENNKNLICRGNYILIVDVPEEREEELIEKVIYHYPNTHIAPESTE